MSIAPNDNWSGRPSRTPRASKIIPAHVPNTDMPAAIRSANGLNRPLLTSNFDMVVDSPPGITSASTLARSDGVRTSLAVTPHSASILMWASNAP